MLRKVIRYRYAFSTAGMLLLLPAAFLLARFPKDFMPDIDEGSDPLHANNPARTSQ